jgi:hypothetical protein
MPEDPIAWSVFFPGACAQDKGITVNSSIFPRACSQKGFFTPLSVLAATCKIHIKSQKNPKIANPILLCLV